VRTIQPRERIDRAVTFLSRQPNTQQRASEAAQVLSGYANENPQIEKLTWPDLLAVLVEASAQRWTAEQRETLDKRVNGAQRQRARRLNPAPGSPSRRRPRHEHVPPMRAGQALDEFHRHSGRKTRARIGVV
jgi:hypothetical protein